MDEHLLTNHPEHRSDFQSRFEASVGSLDLNRIAAEAIAGRYPNLPKIDTSPRAASFTFERP